MPLPRPFVVTVTSNIKGGVSATLTEKTLIVGPNGEGKSAIVNALTLALTGAADDLIGRDVVRDASVIGLMAPVGEDVRATAKLSNGVESSYHAPRSADGFGKGKGINVFPGAVPLRDVREALTGSAEKARQFLLARAARGVTAADVLRVIPEAYHAAYANAVRAASASAMVPADQLLAVIANAKAAATDNKRRAEAADGLVQGRAATLPPEPLDADVRTLQAIVNAAQDASTAAAVAHRTAGISMQATNSVVQLRDEAEHAIKAFNEGRALLAELDAAMPANTEASVASEQLWRSVAMIAGRSAEKLGSMGMNAGPCACCSKTASVEDFRAGVAWADAALAKMAETSMRIAKRRQVADSLVRAKAEALRAIEAVERAALLTPATLPTAGLADPAAASVALAAAHATLTEALQARTAWQEVRYNRSAAESARSAQAEAQAVVDATRGAVEALLDSAATEFVARVNAHLPAAYRFALQLRDGEKAVCRYGFAAADGGVLSAVSGAEWALLTVALTLACTPDDPTTPVVIVPEERAFDPDTLRAALIALADAPTQIVITSPIRPTGRLPAGWSMIEVGASTSPAGDGTPPRPRGRPRKVRAEEDAPAPTLEPLGEPLALEPLALEPLGEPLTLDMATEDAADSREDPFDRIMRALAGHTSVVGEAK